MYENVCDIFRYFGVETKFGQQIAGPVMMTFSKFRQKITGFKIWKGFVGNLEHPNIWILNI
jgi:hypothetical protein